MHITTYHLALGSVTLAAAADNTPRSFAGVANSGQPFIYKGQRTVIDLAGISHKSDVPALSNTTVPAAPGWGICL